MSRYYGRATILSFVLMLVLGCGAATGEDTDTEVDGSSGIPPCFAEEGLSCGPGRQQVCGGIAGLSCSAGSYCALEVGNCCCDMQGTCEEIPSMCTMDFDPVCGCDRNTYSNACAAATAGVSVDHIGKCS